MWDKAVGNKANDLIPASSLALQYEHPLATGTFTATSRGMLVAQCARRVCHYNKPEEDNVGLATSFTFDTKTGKSDVRGVRARIPIVIRLYTRMLRNT